jgi:ABC-type nitrate/sulfonate/bicarbonate transport system substrate-binding protein
MMAGSTRRLAALGVVTLLVLGACTGTSGPSTSAGAPSSGGSGGKTIFFGTGTTQAEVYLLPVLIRGREILAEQGIGLEYAALSNDEVVSAAVASGRVDVALNSLTGSQRAIKAGLGMRWTLTNETQNTFVFVTSKDVTDLTQLKGKKIGLQDPTSLVTPLLPGYLAEADLTVDDVEVVYLAGSSARAAALTAGTLDATFLFRQVAVQLETESNGDFVIWGGGAKTLEPMMWEGFVMSDAFRQNKELANAFVKASLQAYEEFYAGDPAELAEAYLAEERPETTGLDPAETAEDLAAFQETKVFPTDGGLDQALYDRMNELLVTAGQLTQDEVLPYTDVVDRSFVDAAGG